MLTIKSTIFIASVAMIFVLIKGQEKALVDVNCLDCICQVSSNCNLSIGCFNSGNLSFCGPFGISESYWIDAESPVILNDHKDNRAAFANCVTDLYCAAETVNAYMKKFVKGGDCNKDGVVDCVDYALMHSRGAYACNETTAEHEAFFNLFQTCWHEVNPTTIMPEEDTTDMLFKDINE